MLLFYVLRLYMLRRGMVVGIVGGNGVGKTTLLDMLLFYVLRLYVLLFYVLLFYVLRLCDDHHRSEMILEQ
jgi:hypothetical protein